MNEESFERTIERIRAADPRYRPGAYLFVRQGLDVTLRGLVKSGKVNPRQHISAGQLLDGLRAHALEQFGPLARAVLGHWGVRNGRDVGEIVFNLIDHGILGKNEGDRIEDFDDWLSFEDAFDKPFRPRRVAACRAPAAGGRTPG